MEVNDGVHARTSKPSRDEQGHNDNKTRAPGPHRRLSSNVRGRMPQNDSCENFDLNYQ